MNPKAMIWISVVLSALAQIFLKRGLTNLQAHDLGTRGLFGLAIGCCLAGFHLVVGYLFRGGHGSVAGRSAKAGSLLCLSAGKRRLRSRHSAFGHFLS